MAAGAIALGLLVAFGAGPVWSGLIDGVTAAVQKVPGHLGHAYVDSQGAVAMLPAFQLSLFVAIWVAVCGMPDWTRLVVGVAVIGVLQGTASVTLGELHHHLGVDPHVSLIRAWALGLPVLVASILEGGAAWFRRRPLISYASSMGLSLRTLATSAPSHHL